MKIGLEAELGPFKTDLTTAKVVKFLNVALEAFAYVRAQ